MSFYLVYEFLFCFYFLSIEMKNTVSFRFSFRSVSRK